MQACRPAGQPFSREAGAVAGILPSRPQEDRPGRARRGFVDTLRNRLCAGSFGTAWMERRIAEKNELSKRLYVDRILHFLAQDLLLPRLQERPPDRRAAKHVDEKVLREQIGELLSRATRPISNRAAAEEGYRTDTQI
jgi:hypothetical protein